MASPFSNIVFDCTDPAAQAEFWAHVTGYYKRIADADFALLVDTDGVGPSVIFQQVPEPKQGKNRVHVERTVPDLEREVERLTQIGAIQLSCHQWENTRCAVLADPEGNEFCVVQH